MRELLLLPRPRHLERLGAGAPLGGEPRVERDLALPAQGFALETGPDAVRVRAADAAGERYARRLLAQLAGQATGGHLPGVRVRDWPDFPLRGFMLDVSRDRVPTRETLARLVELLDLLRINHLQLYVEHAFAYRAHPVVWRDASPLTPDDLRWLDALCRERGIELAANQNCFGHMGRWLAHPEYRARAEAPDGWRTRTGALLPPGVLAPDAENARFAVELCREQLACLTSRRVNVGCDETFELGRGRSRAEVEARGAGRVYAEHLLRILEPLHADGCDVLFWGDVVRNHPEVVPELPRKATTALAWHYEAPASAAALPEPAAALLEEFGVTREQQRGFASQVPAFRACDFPFWVCPGTSTWNSLVGRLPNARANLVDAAEVGRAAGARGYLITCWGDNGHLDPPSVSFAPLAYGAAASWCLAENRDLDLPAVLDRFVFEDAASELGEVLEQIGCAYLGTGRSAFNASPLFHALVGGGLLGSMGETDVDETRVTLESLEAARAALERARPACADAELVRLELATAIRLARHATWRMLRGAGAQAPSAAELRRDLAEAIEEQRACWLARSRPGGLRDSLARLEAALAGYRD
jgi:hypothetical protein